MRHPLQGGIRFMGWPEKEAVIRPLGAKSTQGVGKLRKVDLLGFKGNLKWTQAADALRIELPPRKPWTTRSHSRSPERDRQGRRR